MKFLRDFSFKNKRVLLRVDFDVPLKNGQIVDDLRIQTDLPTIKYLIEKEAKIILISHLGRPIGRNIEFSLQPIAQYLSQLLKQEVKFLNDCLGEDVEKEIERLKPKQIVLLENLRFYPEERNNEDSFSQKLARLGDVYVNNAFGTIHRAHASIVGLPKYLPSCAGLLLEKEIKALSDVLEKPKRPLMVIIGGAKISTKIKMIERFLEKADNLILGGALANTVISAKGFAIGKSVAEEKMIEETKKLDLTNIKLHIPVDVIVSTDRRGQALARIAPVGNTEEEEMILDIGPDTTQLFSRVISQAKMIIWNGPMGLFEIEKFAQGTKDIAKAVVESPAYSLVGGGDTISCLNQMNLIDKIDYVSTGGGAMLQFLAGEKLPGIEALEN